MGVPVHDFVSPHTQEATCDTCKMTYEDFKKAGKGWLCRLLQNLWGKNYAIIEKASWECPV